MSRDTSESTSLPPLEGRFGSRHIKVNYVYGDTLDDIKRKIMDATGEPVVEVSMPKFFYWDDEKRKKELAGVITVWYKTENDK